MAEVQYVMRYMDGPHSGEWHDWTKKNATRLPKQDRNSDFFGLERRGSGDIRPRSGSPLTPSAEAARQETQASITLVSCSAKNVAPSFSSRQSRLWLERWLSGLKRTPGKREYSKRVPGVRIPLSPPLICDHRRNPCPT